MEGVTLTVNWKCEIWIVKIESNWCKVTIQWKCNSAKVKFSRNTCHNNLSPWDSKNNYSVTWDYQISFGWSHFVVRIPFCWYPNPKSIWSNSFYFPTFTLFEEEKLKKTPRQTPRHLLWMGWAPLRTSSLHTLLVDPTLSLHRLSKIFIL